MTRRSSGSCRRPTSALLAVWATLAAWLVPSSAGAQLSLSNLAVAQAGSDPFKTTVPSNRFDLYDRLDLDYDFSSLRLGLRFESDHHTEERVNEPGYAAITQRYAEWSDPHLHVRVGNFYTILGRGLIARSFELPGVVLDQTGFPSRYSPTRDVDGVLGEATLGPFDARLYSGRPNTGEFSPAVDQVPGYQRYQGLTSGAQGSIRLPRSARIGAAYMRLVEPPQPDGSTGLQSEFGTGFAEVDPIALCGLSELAGGSLALPLYFEYARKNSTWKDWWQFGRGSRDTAALYAGGNLLVGPFALSAEWKDYRAFRMLVNDPPSLVREHPYKLLNRSTHFLVADGEKGYQLEATYALPVIGSVTVNQSRADGDQGSRVRPHPVRFEEHYAELHVAPRGHDVAEGTIFLQRGKDTFLAESISDRTIVGANTTVRFLERWSIAADVERLEATRVSFAGRPVAQFVDHYVSIGVSRAEWGSVSMVLERSTDPNEEDPDDFTSPGIQPNTFLAGIATVRISDRNEATLFVGERRSGLECTAGTCYVVNAFKGAELKLSTRL